MHLPLTCFVLATSCSLGLIFLRLDGIDEGTATSHLLALSVGTGGALFCMDWMRTLHTGFRVLAVRKNKITNKIWHQIFVVMHCTLHLWKLAPLTNVVMHAVFLVVMNTVDIFTSLTNKLQRNKRRACMSINTSKHISQARGLGSHKSGKGEGGELFDAYDDNTSLTESKYMSKSRKAMMAFVHLMHDNDSSEDEGDQHGQDHERGSASVRLNGVIGGIAGVSRYSMRDADKESGDEEENHRESRYSSPNRRPSRRPSQLVTRDSLLSNRPSTSIIADVTFIRSNEAFKRRASTLQQQQQQQQQQQTPGSGSARVMPPRASTYNKWHAEVESPWVGGASSSHSRNNSLSSQSQIPFSSSPSAIKISSAKKASSSSKDNDNSANDDVDASPCTSSTSSPSNATSFRSLSTTSSTSSLMMMNSSAFSTHTQHSSHLSVVNEASSENGRSSSPSFERSFSSFIQESASGKEEWERTAAHTPPPPPPPPPPPAAAVDRIPPKVEEKKG